MKNQCRARAATKAWQLIFYLFASRHLLVMASCTFSSLAVRTQCPGSTHIGRVCVRVQGQVAINRSIIQELRDCILSRAVGKSDIFKLTASATRPVVMVGLIFSHGDNPTNSYSARLTPPLRFLNGGCGTPLPTEGRLSGRIDQ